MTEETPSTDSKQQLPDLSGLADFNLVRHGQEPEPGRNTPVPRRPTVTGIVRVTAGRAATTVTTAAPEGAPF